MFTYRWELGGRARPRAPAGWCASTSYEMASRLSYTILASMPDAELFAAAAAGQLNNPDKIAEQARRLLASDKAKVGLRRVHRAVAGGQLPADPDQGRVLHQLHARPSARRCCGRAGPSSPPSCRASRASSRSCSPRAPRFVDGPLAKLYGVDQRDRHRDAAGQPEPDPAGRHPDPRQLPRRALRRRRAAPDPPRSADPGQGALHPDHPAARLRAAAGQGRGAEHLEPQAVRGVDA